MATLSLAPAGARCAAHTDRVAHFTCGRCGNFICDECSQGGSSAQCPKCLTLTGGDFPFSRNDFDFNRVWDYAFELWKREWVMLSVGAVIFFGVSMVGGLFSQFVQTLAGARSRTDVTSAVLTVAFAGLCGQLVSTVLQGAVQLGYFRMVFDVLKGKKADVGRMFTQLDKLPRYVAQLLLIGLMVALPLAIYLGVVFGLAWAASGASSAGGFEPAMRAMFEAPAPAFIIFVGMAVLVPVAIYVSIPLKLAPMELVYGDCGAVEALQRAWRLADGFRLPIFGYAFVGGLVLLAGLLAGCIGLLPAFGLEQLLTLALFLALRSGSGLAGPREEAHGGAGRLSGA